MAQWSREQAWELLTRYNREPFHLQHARTVEGVLRYFARQLGYGEEEDFWGLAGLLHDLDFEQYPDQHCIRCQEILRENGADERLIHAVCSHGYGITVVSRRSMRWKRCSTPWTGLTGLIGAVALMRPSKSVQDLELKSVKKKYKSPSFAAGCSRRLRPGAAMLGWGAGTGSSAETILAMRSCEQPAGQP